MFWDGPGENMSIFAGTLDSPTRLRVTGHIFCADKGDSYETPADLPQVPGEDPDLTTMVR